MEDVRKKRDEETITLGEVRKLPVISSEYPLLN